MFKSDTKKVKRVMASIAVKRRRRDQSEPPSEARATESRASDSAATEAAATEAAATETSALQTVLLEMRRMREEQARREEEIAAMLRRHDEEIQLLRGSRQRPITQLSPSEFRSESRGSRETEIRIETGYKLKPDTFDGTASLREFFSQFTLIARANRWDDATKTVVLASCLRGKARSVLESIEDLENCSYEELKSKLELRFGEGQLSQNSYTQFTNRKQKFGEDFATFGSELERLARLAYPECSYAVRDKIACAQFISSLLDGFVRRTLQLEGLTSLKLAIERAKAVKIIQGENFDRKKDFQRRFEKGKGDARTFEKRDKEEEKGKKKGGIEKGNWKKTNTKECWLCGKTGHFRSDCPKNEGNTV